MLTSVILVHFFLQYSPLDKNEFEILKTYAYNYAIKNRISKKTMAIIITRGCGAYHNTYYIEHTIFNPRVYLDKPDNFYFKNGYVNILYHTNTLPNKEIFSDINDLLKLQHIVLKDKLSRTYNPVLWRIDYINGKYILQKNYILTANDSNYGCK